MDRIATFKRFAAQRPDDPFPVYSLAMEHRSRGEHSEAQVWFDQLAERFAGYVPGYFHAGANLASLGRIDEARARYRAGVEVAERAGDHHALDELRAALAQIGG
jgi:tetratricopeptide (TPR) repeat protein